MKTRQKIANALAAAILRRRLTVEEFIRQGSTILGRRWRWLPGLARRAVAQFGSGTRPRALRLARFIQDDAPFQKACQKHALAAFPALLPLPTMAPAPGPPRKWKVPPLRTSAELAEWFQVPLLELKWFADCRTQERKLPPGPLRHYHYHWRRKREGTARLIEAPKPRLKAFQRRLLDKLLLHVPPHSAAHGFRRRRSIKTFVKPHLGRRIVLKTDLKDFFPCITKARVVAILMTAGYPETVATLLSGLCTNSTPSEVIRSCPPEVLAREGHRLRQLYQRPHLPQGAPTSPALANLSAFRLDCRLSGLAKAAGARYTRYADDLLFSGDEKFARQAERFHIRVCAIALEEGFEVHTRKTRLMRRGVCQRAAGLVLNQHANVPRENYDQLKATVHNCLAHGPAGQNRHQVADFRAHLAGRIAHLEMIHPGRGQRLRRQFEAIQWPGVPSGPAQNSGDEPTS